MKNKVLILGSQGTLGQSLVNEFQKNGYEVVAWDRGDLDVTAPDAPKKIKDLHPQIIINAIAYNAVNKMETDENERKIAFLINAKAPGILANTAKSIGAIFVHYSTSYVFPGDKKEGYRETDTPGPVDIYGESKLEGEKAVEKVGGKYYILRLSRLFGVKGASEMSKRTFVDIMITEIDKSELEVGDTEVSSLTYAPDLAKVTRKIVEENKPYGIYHSANEGLCTWYEWAKEIFKDLGKGPKVIPAKHTLTPGGVKHPQYSGLINTKLSKQRTWQEALKEFIEAEYKNQK
ncbi:MAG: dTDP-4-dehydrorhamnose reductase [Candidatus Microgenomates bacterium]|jgi:dTDP-4-dehydrorhamnose reductase